MVLLAVALGVLVATLLASASFIPNSGSAARHAVPRQRPSKGRASEYAWVAVAAEGGPQEAYWAAEPVGRLRPSGRRAASPQAAAGRRGTRSTPSRRRRPATAGHSRRASRHSRHGRSRYAPTTGRACRARSSWPRGRAHACFALQRVTCVEIKISRRLPVESAHRPLSTRLNG